MNKIWKQKVAPIDIQPSLSLFPFKELHFWSSTPNLTQITDVQEQEEPAFIQACGLLQMGCELDLVRTIAGK